MPLDIDDDKPFGAISNSNIQVPFQVSEGPNYFFYQNHATLRGCSQGMESMYTESFICHITPNP